VTDGRRILPNRRRAETFELRHGNHSAVYSVSVGYYDDGAIGELFIHGAKVGSQMEAVVYDLAVVTSISLQFGASLEVLCGAIIREADGSPSTILGAVLDKLTAARPQSEPTAAMQSTAPAQIEQPNEIARDRRMAEIARRLADALARSARSRADADYKEVALLKTELCAAWRAEQMRGAS
jgi:ribonucleoside-diphosphate reductase alpha chain